MECVAPVINSLDLNALIQSHCLTFPLGVRGLTNILRVPAWQAVTYSQITAHFIFVVLCWGNHKEGGGGGKVGNREMLALTTRRAAAATKIMEIRFLIRSSREPMKTGSNNGRSLYKWNHSRGQKMASVLCR